MDCIFCKIVKKEIPSHVVFENDEFLAFLDIGPRALGHTLVIPKRHSTLINGMTEDEVAKLLPVVKQVRNKIEQRLKPDGFNIGWNDGTAAGQVVPHLHMHIIPRWTGDGGLGMHGSVDSKIEKSLDNVAEMLK